MKIHSRRAASLTASLFVCFLAALDVNATPTIGETVPDAHVEDVDGRAVEVRGWKDKPTVLFYEGKDSAEQNRSLKEELAKLAKSAPYRSSLRIAAIGDVSAYDYWPAKGIVKDKVREESKLRGMPIYCDWTGSFGAKFKVKSSVSNVIVIGRGGRVIFTATGALKAPDRERLVELLRTEVQST